MIENLWSKFKQINLLPCLLKVSFESSLRVDHAGLAAFAGTVGIAIEQFLDASEHRPQRRRVRQGRDAEMIAVRHVEAHTRRHQHVLLLEQIERKLLIVELRQRLRIDSNKGVHRTLRRREPKIAAMGDGLENGSTRFVQPPAGTDNLSNALVAPKRRLTWSKQARGDGLENGSTRFVQPPAGTDNLSNALVAPKRRLHGPLRRHVAAQAQRAQQLPR